MSNNKVRFDTVMYPGLLFMNAVHYACERNFALGEELFVYMRDAALDWKFYIPIIKDSDYAATVKSQTYGMPPIAKINTMTYPKDFFFYDMFFQN